MTMTLAEWCELPLLCTYTLPENCEGMSPADCPIILDYTLKNEQGHSIHTEVKFDFFGNEIIVCKTDRSWLLKSEIFVDLAKCGHLETTKDCSGIVSESCVHEHADIYYLNIQDEVCLYKKTEFHVEFEGSPDSDPVEGRGPDGFTYLFSKFGVNITTYCTESWIFICKGVVSVLKTDNIDNTYNNKRVLFLSPTPDQISGFEWVTFDEEFVQYGCYNIYEACLTAAPDSKTALDGTADGAMFFPDWCRERVIDEQWEIAARSMYQACRNQVNVNTLSDEYAPEAVVKSLPLGDFARHPVHGDFYSFILASDKVFPPIVINHLDNGVPEDILNTVTGYLEDKTAFSAISLI